MADSSQPSRAASARIPALDGLRAVSIALVVYSHVSGTRHFGFGPPRALVGDLGNLGVSVFFVISGYLITKLLFDERARRQRIDLVAFYVRRGWRILPAAATYLFVLFVLASTTAAIHLSASDWMHAITFTMNYYQQRRWCVGHLWSLSVEEQFYVLWPAAIAWLGERRSLWLAANVVALAPLWRVVAWVLWPDARDGIGETFPTVMDAIAIGCLLAGTADWLTSRVWYRWFIGSPAFLVMPATVWICNALGRYPSFYLPIGMTARNVGIAAIVHWAVLESNRVAAGILESRGFRFVGKISYSLYLWQQPFLNRHRAILLAAFPFNITAAVVCALLSFTFIEAPLLRLRERLRTRGSSEHLALSAVS
jgi:peptidoglycan/LPS O-acetylase OafA/YrhL